MARFYGWTYQTIADMTPEQCRAAMDAAADGDNTDRVDSGKPGLDGNLHFSTREEWEIWKQTRGIK